MKTIETPVLIVGGGPVGLFTSILLSRYGVPSLLVERHTGTSIYPKARLVNTRTMEICRQCGLEEAVRAISLPPEESHQAIWARTLVGEELHRRTFDSLNPELSERVSPTSGCTTSQEVLEPMLLSCARQFDLGKVRFGAELTTFAQDNAGVSATLIDRERGVQTRVRAQYLIGADGAHSRVREVLGISMIGPSELGHTMNIMFQADLSTWVAGRSINLAFIQHPDAPGVLLASDGVRRWVFQAFYSPAAGQRTEDFTPKRCLELVRTAVGVPDLNVEVLRAIPWSPAARVAARFLEGRVLLAGDAAHEMPPTGGFGMNAGIQDVHNLAWKLAALLTGWAGPALLETYERERQPTDRWITEQSLRNLESIRQIDSGGSEADPGMRDGREEFLREQGLVFAATYDSAAVVSDGTALPNVENPVAEYVPTAHPGCRAPHLWLERVDQQLSTLDLFGTGFVLLTGRTGSAWCQAAAEVTRTLHLPLQAFRIGADGDLLDTGDRWATAYGVEQDGTVLVRPDGHVAWRARSCVANPTQALYQVLASVLGGMRVNGRNRARWLRRRRVMESLPPILKW